MNLRPKILYFFYKMRSQPIYANTLNRRIALATVVMGFASMVLLGSLKGLLSARQARRDFTDSLGNIMDAYVPALESALALGDAAVLQTQIEGIGELTYTSYAAVHAEGRTLAESGTADGNPSLLLERPLYRSGSGDAAEIGKLVVHGDDAYLQQTSWDWIYKDFPLESIGVALLGLFLYFYIDRVVTGRIRRNTERIEGYKIGTPGPLFDVPRDGSRPAMDEIRLMEAGFNRLAAALQSSFAKQEIEQAAALRNYRRYQDLFDYSPIPLMLIDFSAAYQEMLADFPNLDRPELAEKMRDSGRSVRKYAELVSVSDLNVAMRDLVEAPDKDTVLSGVENIVAGEAEPIFREHLAALATGAGRHLCEGIIGTFTGGHRHVQAHWLALNYGSDLRTGHVLIAFVDITTGKHMEEALADKVREREVLIRELFHRTKNNMQSILSFISFESWRLEDESMRAALHRLESRIYSMSLVHRMLYEYADLSRLSLSAYLREYAAYLGASENLEEKGIRIDLQLEELVVTVDIAVPIGLIVTELVDNALAHAFAGRQGGVILIRLESAGGGDLTLTVADDGVGAREDFDPAAVESLGLQLVGSIAESQLGGGVSYQCAPERGFSCRIFARPSLYEVRV